MSDLEKCVAVLITTVNLQLCDWIGMWLLRGHSLVEINQPKNQFLRSCLVPMDSVAFLKSYYWLILLVVGALAQSSLQVQRMCIVVIFYDFHLQIR